MRFVLTDDQRDFAAALDRLLAASDTVGGRPRLGRRRRGPGLKLWARLAEQGVTALATEATPVEVCVAFEALGRHAVPGPWVESAAYLPVLLGRELEGGRHRGGAAARAARARRRRRRPVFVGDGDSVTSAEVGPMRRSVDPTRRLFEVTATGGFETGASAPSSTTERSTWPCWRPRPSCSGSASACSPTR